MSTLGLFVLFYLLVGIIVGIIAGTLVYGKDKSLPAALVTSVLLGAVWPATIVTIIFSLF